MMAAGTQGRTHADAVDAVRASYGAIPPGRAVRLAKPTSNLFRYRGTTPTVGLDVSALTDVISVDAVARTADVQGMCTYERLVEVTLAHGLMPLVVPQLKTITLGGAVTGLGIESSAFRNGLPHESVIEMDILTGDGRVVTASATENADLFMTFPNSYGSLGYALRLRIELEPVQPFVAIRHIPFNDLDALADAIGQISAKRTWAGERVDFLDGVVFDGHGGAGAETAYLTLGRFAADLADAGATGASDYTGQQVFYKSIRERARDCLTIHDYIWRWDTDWFWCSGAFGAQNPIARRLWPAKYRRSDFYYRLVNLENRYRFAARIDRWRGLPERERVVQDVEIPLEQTAEFLRWFAANVPMSPIWLCPLQLREPEGAESARVWPLYPLKPGQVYVNVGFWGTVPITEGRNDGDVNRLVEGAVARSSGHKSLYSDAYYDRETFEAVYGGEVYRAVKDTYDPGHRLTGLYEKAVGRQ
jgi:FAD/FMN-containing dehydrogenase